MILVAGGNGFIGRAVIKQLAGSGEPIAIMSHRPEAVKPGLGGNVEVRRGDARDEASLVEAVKGVDTVISCMQFPNFPVENKKKGYTFMEVDARGNERLVRAAKAAGVKNYLYLSGAGAAADAPKIWFRAKWQAEQAISSSGMRYVIFRPSWVYGPEDKSLNQFVRFAKMLPFVPVIGDGKQRMQPVFIDDVARCVAESVKSERATNKVFEIGGPAVMSMDDVLRTMLDVMKRKKPLLHAPVALPKLAAAAMSVLPSPPLSPDAIEFIINDAVADVGPLRAAFDIQLTPLREGLTTYLAAK